VRAPYLQEASGCERPAPGVMVEIGEFGFNECPVRFAGGEEMAIVEAWAEGREDHGIARERMLLPAALAEAFAYLDSIHGRREG
jgi:hypothetical protein